MSLFLGFLKAVAQSFMPRKKYRQNSGDSRNEPDKSYWDLDTEIPDPDDKRDMEFWRAEAEKLAERKGQEKADAEKRMIEDYESRHAEEASTETAEFGGEAEETDDSSGTDDFHADVGIEIDEDF